MGSFITLKVHGGIVVMIVPIVVKTRKPLCLKKQKEVAEREEREEPEEPEEQEEREEERIKIENYLTLFLS